MYLYVHRSCSREYQAPLWISSFIISTDGEDGVETVRRILSMIGCLYQALTTCSHLIKSFTSIEIQSGHERLHRSRCDFAFEWTVDESPVPMGSRCFVCTCSVLGSLQEVGWERCPTLVQWRRARRWLCARLATPKWISHPRTRIHNTRDLVTS